VSCSGRPKNVDRFCAAEIGVEEPLAPALGALAVGGILWNVGDYAGIENTLAIVCGIKAAIEVQIGASEVQPDLLGHLLQGVQTLRQ